MSALKKRIREQKKNEKQEQIDRICSEYNRLLKKDKVESIKFYFKHSELLRNRPKIDKCFRSQEEKESFSPILDVIKKNKLEQLLDREDTCPGLSMVTKYRERWVRDPLTFVKKGRSVRRQYDLFLKHLFCKYEIPDILIRPWYRTNGNSSIGIDYLDQRLCELLIEVGQGKNIRECHQTPLPLTKKMAHLFMTQSPCDLSIQEGLRNAEARSLGADRRLAKQIAYTKLNRIFSNPDFWRSVIMFFIANPMLNSDMFDPIIDYIISQKFQIEAVVIDGVVDRRIPQPNFSMKGRSASVLLNSVESWHHRLNKDREMDRFFPQKWDPSGISPYEESINENDKIIIEELVTRKQLSLEGKRMNHCVSSYALSCSRGKTSIWSMRKYSFGLDYVPMITIEVVPNHGDIVQVRGKHNRRPNPYEMNILRKWANKVGLNLTKSTRGW